MQDANCTARGNTAKCAKHPPVDLYDDYQTHQAVLKYFCNTIAVDYSSRIQDMVEVKAMTNEKRVVEIPAGIPEQAVPG